MSRAMMAFLLMPLFGFLMAIVLDFDFVGTKKVIFFLQLFVFLLLADGRGLVPGCWMCVLVACGANFVVGRC